jgi:uncharacterized protein YigE (DUF2233 family)
MPRPLIYLQLFLLMMACSASQADQPLFLAQYIDLKEDHLALFYLDENQKPLRSFRNLKAKLEKEQKVLKFAMNAGMFHPDRSPVGLYIEEGEVLEGLNTQKGKGNFYMQPNGVFYWTKEKKAEIVNTADFQLNDEILYATQSGPMLIIDGKINTKFGINSSSKHYRNGVGLLPDGRLIFVISTQKVNFYNFANYFKTQGCYNALYLDGFVSKIYAPEYNVDALGGDFGVMIGSWE